MEIGGSRTGETRNPGPSWGYSFIALMNRILPWPLMKVVLWTSSLVSLCLMEKQRRYSRVFLESALGRTPTWEDCWRHFAAFSEFLAMRFDAAFGKDPVFETDSVSAQRFQSLVDGGKQSLQGTFHFGNSDLMGFWLSRFDLSIRMVRFRVGNSSDLDWLEKRFGSKVAFLWVNDPSNIIFALKEAVEAGHSVAMKCDRVEHSSKIEKFSFLGAERWFPFTIYHLSILFDLPVSFSFGVPIKARRTRIFTSEVYRPTGDSKREKLNLARIHFEDTLKMLEALVRKYPYQWFNFCNAIPVVASGRQAARKARMV